MTTKQTDIIQKIQSFSDLEKGWDNGNEKDISIQTINNAIQIVKLLTDIVDIPDDDIDSFPGVDGEIEILVVHNNVTLDIFVMSDNMAMLYCGNELVFRKNISEWIKTITEIVEALEQYCKVNGDDNFIRDIIEIRNTLANKQVGIDPEIEKLMLDNLWDLYLD